MDYFIENINHLPLPNTLWGVHVHPEHKFIAVTHIKLTNSAIDVDKSVKLTSAGTMVKAACFFGNRIIEMPGITSNVQTIADVSRMVDFLEKAKLCSNFSNAGAKSCLKVVTDSDILCSACKIKIAESKAEKQEDSEDSESELGLCAICGKIHTKNDCNAVDKLECNFCGKLFLNKQKLKIHENIHTGLKEFKCTLCPKTYTTSSNLSTHMRSIHLNVKPHICKLCSMAFVHPRFLRLHMRKHTGEKPYECETCHKRFSKKIQLVIHNRLHTGERPYLCDMCFRGFTTAGNLNSHKRVHQKSDDDEVIILETV